MRLPIIKHLVQFIEERDIDFINETIETLEYMTESEQLKEEEIDAIGELLSNLYGAVQVQHAIDQGVAPKQALNDFLKRVVGSIDTE